MAELDSLSIQISASTKKAEDSINNLISTLNKLNGAFDIKNVDGFVGTLQNLADAVNSIQSDNLKDITNAMTGLGKSAKSLATLSTNAGKSGDAVAKLSKKLAGIAGITDKSGISMLTESLREFLQSTNGEQLSASRNKILTIAKTFGTVGTEISKDREEALRFLNELGKAKINLPLDWTKEYGDSAEGKKIRGMIGIGRTVADGSGSDADDVAKRLGIGEYQNAQDAFKAIASVASVMRDIVADTDDEVLTLGEALGSSGEHAREAAEAMKAFSEQLANAVGLTTQQMTDATSGGNGFLPDIENQNIAIEQFIQNAERLNMAGNPFQNIADGLNEIANVNLNDTLVTYLYAMKDSIASIGGKSGQNAGYAMKQIGEGLQALNVPIPDTGEQISEFALALRKLGSGNMTKAAEALPFIAMGLQQLNGIQITADVEKLSELAKAISGFGYAKIDKAVTNLPVLTQELTRLITALSQAPQVSQNTVELVKALGNLNVNARALKPSTRRAGNALDFFSKKAKRARSASFSLAATIGKIYATYWAVFRVIGWLGKSIDIASDLTEVQNVVDQTFGDMKYRMEDFAKTAVETVGMSELTAKQIGSRFQAMGRNMGISQEMIEGTNDFLQATTKMADGSEKAYADVAHSMAEVSINLTRLAGDMASFYNEDYDVVAEKLNAVFTGQTRPLRAYGLDLTQATLQEWALANGMDVDIKKMTQAEKTLLRYQYVMANTTAAHQDFIRTQDTWANTLKRASENLKRLQVILGQIAINTFKPLVANFNAAMNDIIHLAESTLNSLGTIFGWQVEITDVGIVDDLADGLEDVEDGYEGAGKEAKKFKNFLLGIDELNLLPDDKDKDSGSGSGSGLGAMANGIQDSMVNMRETENGYESIYDTLFKLGKRIGEVQLDWYKGIEWDKIFDKVEGAGKGLASFLNGYLSDAELFYHKGRFIAEGINTIAHAIYGFFHEFDGYQLGKDLGFEINGFTSNLDWDIIKSGAYEMTHDVTEFINGAIKNINWKDVGRTIAEMLNTVQLMISTFWNEVHWDELGVSAGEVINSFFLNWDEEEAARLVKGKLQAVLDFANNLLSTTDFEMIGEKIGKFLSDLDLAEYADDIAALIWNLIKAGFKLLPSMFEEAPIETALMLGIAGFKFNLFGAKFGNMMASSVSSNFRTKMISFLTTDLAEMQFHSGILGAGEIIGTAIGGAIVGAAAAYVGYNFGLEIGKALHPEDAMWYKQDAWLEALFNIKEWGNAGKEAAGSVDMSKRALDAIGPSWNYRAKEEFGITDEMTWADVEEAMRLGKININTEDLEMLKDEIVYLGSSASDTNQIFNRLKNAQEEYVNGFKPWIAAQSRLQYEIYSGNTTLETAYELYVNAKKAEEEYANARQLEKKRKEITELTTAYNNLGEGQRNWVDLQERTLNDALTDHPHYLDILSTKVDGEDLTDWTDKARSVVNSLGDAFANVGKKQQKAVSDAVDAQAEALGQLQEYQNFVDMIKVEDVPNIADISGGSGLKETVQQMALLHTNILNSKDGMEKLNAAFEAAGKKDKSSGVNDTYEIVKSKMNDIGSVFSEDNMDSMVSSIPKAMKLAWSDALEIMKEMWIEMARWINENVKIEVPKVKANGKDFGGQTVQVRVQKFDVGGSIPNTGNLFFANESGPEVVANMGSRTGIMNTDQMEAAIANGMARALAANGQNVTVVLQGDASSLFTAMVKENNNTIMRTGASPLRR